MHVPLRRGQVLMAGELLNRARGRAAHREMRAERVAQHVRPVVEERGLLRRASNQSLHHALCQRFIVLVQHEPATQVTVIANHDDIPHTS